MLRSFKPTTRSRIALAVQRLPHPSSGRHGRYPARRRAAVSAAEFWSRLGL